MTDPSPPTTGGPHEPPDVGPIARSAVTADAPQRATRPARATGQYQHAFWFTLLLATTVTLGSISFAIGAYTAAARPETVVREYFAALARGDAAGAAGYGALPDGPKGLLTAQVLAVQNRIGPISDVTVRGVDTTGDTASVHITYAVGFATGPRTVVDTVAVVRQGRGWRLAHAAVAEDLDPTSGSRLAEIAGSVVPSGRYALFPGAVPVTFDTPTLELADSARVARFDDLGDLEVSAQVSAEGRQVIAPALNSALRACLAGRAAVQLACPLPDADADVPGSLLGKQTVALVGKAAQRLRLSVEAADGEIDIAATAPVDATYTALDDNNIAKAATTRTVGLRAHCYATRPGTIVWDAS
jgi:hypothetical protein